MKKFIILFLLISAIGCVSTNKKEFIESKSELVKCIQQLENDTRMYHIPIEIIERHCLKYLNKEE